MRKVLLDANFLILPFQFNVDLFGDLDRLIGEFYEVYTLNRTYNEALSVEDGRYKNMVKRLVKESDPEIEVVQTQGNKPVDDVLLDMAGEFIIATNDKDLRNKMRERELPHIYLRQKNHLEGRNLRNAAFY